MSKSFCATVTYTRLQILAFCAIALFQILFVIPINPPHIVLWHIQATGSAPRSGWEINRFGVPPGFDDSSADADEEQAVQGTGLAGPREGLARGLAAVLSPDSAQSAPASHTSVPFRRAVARAPGGAPPEAPVAFGKTATPASAPLPSSGFPAGHGCTRADATTAGRQTAGPCPVRLLYIPGGPRHCRTNLLSAGPSPASAPLKRTAQPPPHIAAAVDLRGGSPTGASRAAGVSAPPKITAQPLPPPAAAGGFGGFRAGSALAAGAREGVAVLVRPTAFTAVTLGGSPTTGPSPSLAPGIVFQHHYWTGQGSRPRLPFGSPAVLLSGHKRKWLEVGPARTLGVPSVLFKRMRMFAPRPALRWAMTEGEISTSLCAKFGRWFRLLAPVVFLTLCFAGRKSHVKLELSLD